MHVGRNMSAALRVCWQRRCSGMRKEPKGDGDGDGKGKGNRKGHGHSNSHSNSNGGMRTEEIPPRAV